VKKNRAKSTQFNTPGVSHLSF